METQAEADQSTDREQRPRDPVLKWGLIAALTGIAAGVVISVMGLDDFAKVFELPGFSPSMIPSLVLGTLAAALALYALIEERGTRLGAAKVLFLGVAAIATPFLAMYVIGLLVVLFVLMIIAEMSHSM